MHVVVPCHVHFHPIVTKEHNVVRRVEIPTAVIIVNGLLCAGVVGNENVVVDLIVLPADDKENVIKYSDSH